MWGHYETLWGGARRVGQNALLRKEFWNDYAYYGLLSVETIDVYV